MSDIVERLREWSTCNVFPEQAQYVISEACLEITALRAENERLRAALEDIADGLGETDLVEVGRYAKHIARAALEEK